MNGNPVLQAEGLTKSFGSTLALDGLNLTLSAGKVLGLLGHNGAGKTTAVRILTTLLRSDGGHASICGHDVAREAAAVRRNIALAGQQATLDELLTGRENLILLARLLKLSARDARDRAGVLLERFGLVEAADRIVKTYSGGMRRRLDLAACLVAPRPMVFLDEPTTGLDPASRAGMWDSIRELVDDGAAVLLTTQYLEEADRLADSVIVLSRGRTVAQGTPNELKALVGGRRVEAILTSDGDLAGARDAMTALGYQPEIETRSHRISAPAPGGADDLSAMLRALDRAGIVVEEAGLRRPTLDDAFLTLTHGDEAHVAEREVA